MFFPLLLSLAGGFAAYRFIQDLGKPGNLGESFIAPGNSTSVINPFFFLRGDQFINGDLKSIYDSNIETQNQIAYLQSTSPRSPDGKFLNPSTAITVAIAKNQLNLNQVKIDDRHFMGQENRNHFLRSVGAWLAGGGLGWLAAFGASAFLGPIGVALVGLTAALGIGTAGTIHSFSSSKLPLIRFLSDFKKQAIKGIVPGSPYEAFANYIASRETRPGLNWQTAIQSLSIEDFVNKNDPNINRFVEDLATSSVNTLADGYKDIFKNIPLADQLIGAAQGLANTLLGKIA
ncbi:MAG: hypothetical protein SFT81_06770 [Candidatus Caenarcaniphilales bacterium]|nr:hypothetical protein [Candidatus Caenarcaniphilales bacterium]